MAIEINPHLLKQWPLPSPGHDGDKEERGHVLVMAGSAEMPGAAILSSIAALHAGAGKLSIATAAPIASQVAQSVPEARVISLPADIDEDIIDKAMLDEKADELPWLPKGVDAVLIGPGMQDEADVTLIVKAALKRYTSAKVILDAMAMNVVENITGAHNVCTNNILLTPHAGEMATLLNCEKSEVIANAPAMALRAADKWQVAVALKGAETHIALPDQRVWIHRGGDIGLATSGSGDVLAGLIVGLLAQGASIEQGAAWGVTLHALAGEAAAKEIGCTIGYLARELSKHVPRLKGALCS